MRKKIVRAFCSLFAAVLLLPLFPVAAATDAPSIDSSCGVVINLEKGQTIFEKDTQALIKPATFTKLMTALLCYEYRLENGNRPVTVTKEMLSSAGGTTIKLKEGEEISFDDLLTGLVVANANDAALVLASVVGGNIAAFVEKMNERAEKLGMTQTHYSNPTGVDSAAMVSTVGDTAILCREIYRVNDFMVTARIPKATIPATNLTKERVYTNKNALVPFSYVTDYYMEDVWGMSAGYTVGAGHCVAAVRQKNGCTNLVILSGGRDRSEAQNGTDISSYRDAKTLLEWAEETYSIREVMEKGKILCEKKVRLAGGVDHMILVAGETLTALLPKDADLEEHLTVEISTLEEVYTAPIIEGDAYGKVNVLFDGEVIGSTPLVAQSNVSLSRWLVMWDAVQSFFSQGPARVVLILVIVIAILYVFTLIFTVWIQYARRNRARKQIIKELNDQEDRRLRQVRLEEKKAANARFRQAKKFLQAGYQVLSGEAELVQTEKGRKRKVSQKNAPQKRAVAKVPEQYRRKNTGVNRPAGTDQGRKKSASGQRYAVRPQGKNPDGRSGQAPKKPR